MPRTETAYIPEISAVVIITYNDDGTVTRTVKSANEYYGVNVSGDTSVAS